LKKSFDKKVYKSVAKKVKKSVDKKMDESDDKKMDESVDMYKDANDNEIKKSHDERVKELKESICIATEQLKVTESMGKVYEHVRDYSSEPVSTKNDREIRKLHDERVSTLQKYVRDATEQLKVTESMGRLFEHLQNKPDEESSEGEDCD
jgi:hypothetical protein